MRIGVVVEGVERRRLAADFARGSRRAHAVIRARTDGTATILTAAARCETVLIGSRLTGAR